MIPNKDFKSVYVAICEANGIEPTIKNYEKAKRKLLRESDDEDLMDDPESFAEAIEILEERFDKVLMDFSFQWQGLPLWRVHELAGVAFQQAIDKQRTSSGEEDE